MNNRDKYILQNIEAANLFTAGTIKSTDQNFDTAISTVQNKTFDNSIGVGSGESYAGDFADMPSIPKAEFDVVSAIFSPLPVNVLEDLSDEILAEARRYPQNLENEMY